MIDPMADLGSSGAAAETDAKEVFDPVALNQNLQRVDNIRSLMGIVSGCVAGICGLTGLEGLGTYRYLQFIYRVTRLASFFAAHRCKLSLRSQLASLCFT
jgi:hypothetical protein